MERGLPGDRDSDQRRLERERDERRQRQAEARAVDLHGGDGHPDGVAPHGRSRSSPLDTAPILGGYTALQSGSPARNVFCTACICRSNALSYAPSASASQ